MPPQSKRLVLEIGTEELPPSAAWDGIRQLRELAGPALEEARLDAGDLRAYATPRRLVLIVERVGLRLRDLVREIRGPAVRVAFAPDGRPTPAAEGFARAQGIDVGALERRSTPQGEYVYAVRREAGGDSAAALAECLPALAGRLSFPRAMRWGAGTTRFSRPVRWIVALLGEDVVPLRFAGVSAGRETAGHRALHPGLVAVASAEGYEAAMRTARVMVDPEARRRRITAGIRRAARGAGGRPILDPDLLDESVQLVEWPTVLAGRFDPPFLALPREILITVMQHHQKYFAVEDRDGTLLPAFVALRNGGTRNLDGVREGNEWVLRARLGDARFFFEEDRREPLEARIPMLDDVTFLEPLGTMAAKTARLEQLTTRLAVWLGDGPAEARALARAAHLAKADLVTQVVRELPELQGIVGGLYAALDGEPEAVAAGVREQYLPRGGVLPRTAVGARLALLDHADTLAGALSAGLVPSGSQDPYGLRRAANAIVTILLDRHWSVTIPDLTGAVLDGYAVADPASRARVLEAVRDLVRQRLRAALIDEEISYDTVDAALAAGIDLPPDAAARARALWVFRRTAEFAKTYTALDRAARIVPAGFDAEVREDLLTAPAERALLDAIRAASAPRAGDGRPPRGAAAPKDLAAHYERNLRRLASLAGPVDRLFTDVLVMAEDEAVRRNRLGLLAHVVRLVRPIADLSKLVVADTRAEGKQAAVSQA
ncbi:MAG TPA: glycine--tRNA ligase subunit beta [bacterium]|nr:glycine--tRNA ligase subunit beta [bacterium]